MQIPSFEESGNGGRYADWRWRWSDDEYLIDFTTQPHRRYKEEVRGVRVYENGMVRIEPHVYGQPEVRSALRSRYEMEFLNPYESSTLGYTFTTPEGKPIKKSWIARKFYLFDFRHHMMVDVPAFFYGGHARLVSDKMIEISEYKKGLADEFRKKQEPLMNLATAFAAMKPDERRYRYYTAWQWFGTNWPDMDTIDKAVDQHSDFLYWLAEAQRQQTLNMLIRKHVREHYQVPFLYFKEGS